MLNPIPGELVHRIEWRVVPYLYLIGDGLAPRTLREATYEGHRSGTGLVYESVRGEWAR